MVKLQDAGHRERSFALHKWDKLPWTRPFWKCLEVWVYDPINDEIVTDTGDRWRVELL